jgi:hypothetical protein
VWAGRRFYKRQNEILENFTEVDTLIADSMPSSALRAAVGREQGINTNSEKLAMRISFGFNMILFAAKVTLPCPHTALSAPLHHTMRELRGNQVSRLMKPIKLTILAWRTAQRVFDCWAFETVAMRLWALGHHERGCRLLIVLKGELTAAASAATAVQVFASVQSGSLSIITSALDSFLDLVSGCILFLTARSMRKNNKYKYAPWPHRTHISHPWALREQRGPHQCVTAPLPRLGSGAHPPTRELGAIESTTCAARRFPVGKSRMQPLGIIVFSSIMGTVGFQVRGLNAPWRFLRENLSAADSNRARNAQCD